MAGIFLIQWCESTGLKVFPFVFYSLRTPSLWGSENFFRKWRTKNGAIQSSLLSHQETWAARKRWILKRRSEDGTVPHCLEKQRAVMPDSRGDEWDVHFAGCSSSRYFWAGPRKLRRSEKIGDLRYKFVDQWIQQIVVMYPFFIRPEESQVRFFHSTVDWNPFLTPCTLLLLFLSDF